MADYPTLFNGNKGQLNIKRTGFPKIFHRPRLIFLAEGENIYLVDCGVKFFGFRKNINHFGLEDSFQF